MTRRVRCALEVEHTRPGETEMPAYGIGELAAIIGMFAMFADGEGVTRTEALRTALGGLHGLAVFAGLELLLWSCQTDPEWLQTIFRVGNVFSFAVVGAMLSIVYPGRSDEGSTFAMWEVTFSPLVVALLWGGFNVVVLGVSWDIGPFAFRSLSMLALHYYLVSGMIILMLLLEPPKKTAAADLPLIERLTSVFGIFWLVLMALWWGQAWFVLQGAWAEVFGSSVLSALVAAFLSLGAVVRTARYGRGRLS